ncbi:MAG TPA: hypothetical protein PKJ33_00775 [Alphaproteobacteria bacterium]|nr:hypothetical protein [Alphaproteobacteria bacterium]
MKNFLIAFFMILITEGYSGAVLVTGWCCGSCTAANLAISESSTFCDENPCDESCYSCGNTSTPQSVAITGGTRYWNEVCPNTGVLVYCKNGIAAACDLGGMLS